MGVQITNISDKTAKKKRKGPKNFEPLIYSI